MALSTVLKAYYKYDIYYLLMGFQIFTYFLIFALNKRGRMAVVDEHFVSSETSVKNNNIDALNFISKIVNLLAHFS